jgi:hypothetical protein
MITIREIIFNSSLKLHKLTQATASLKTIQNPGPNSGTVEFNKHFGPVVLPIPAVRRKAINIPILKANKLVAELSSYQPTSLTSTSAKTLEKMVIARLNWYLETKNLLSLTQADFRRYCSTNQHIVILRQEIKYSIDRKEIMLVVFVDFKSAHDSIWMVKLMDSTNYWFERQNAQMDPQLYHPISPCHKT